MKNKIAITISALCASLYGIVGFWINLGNETINPVLFMSFMMANVMALILIIISAYNWSKKQVRKNTIKNGVICLILSAICFAAFAFLLSNADQLGTIKFYSLFTAVFIAFGITSIVYSISFMLFSVVKKS